MRLDTMTKYTATDVLLCKGVRSNDEQYDFDAINVITIFDS